MPPQTRKGNAPLMAKKLFKNEDAEVVEPESDMKRVEQLCVKLPVNDDLNLKSVDVSEVPSSILFPGELNRFLREQIQNLKSENGRLQRALEERTAALVCAEARKPSVTFPLVGLGRASELAASKIVELSKRVRELTAELESNKTRCKEIEQKLAAFEVGHKDNEVQGESPASTTKDETEDQVRILTEKLQWTNQKLCESRNQCQQLKQEVKLVQKALASEVGEPILPQALSTWRGRAQQILTLQQKVSELQHRLKAENLIEKPTDSRAAVALRRLEKERRAAHEQTDHALRDTTLQLEELRRRFDAARARTRVLEGELGTARGRLATLLEKGRHDDQLIAALSGQMSAAEARWRERDTEEHRRSGVWEEERRSSQQDLLRERAKAEQLAAVVAEKEERLQHLEHELKETATKRPTSDGVTPREPSPTDEAERLRLLELVAVMNRRVEEARIRAEGAENSLRSERKRAARLETRLARVEMEMRRSQAYRRIVQVPDPEVPQELADQLELRQEEILALRTRLKTVLQEKEDDLRAYTALLEMRTARH